MSLAISCEVRTQSKCWFKRFGVATEALEHEDDPTANHLKLEIRLCFPAQEVGNPPSKPFDPIQDSRSHRNAVL